MMEYKSADPSGFFRQRLLILRLGFLVLATVALARLYQLQVVNRQPLAAKAAMQYQQSLRAQAPRGAIYERNGRELAASLPVPSAYLVPTRFKDYHKLEAVAEVLEMQTTQLADLASSPKSFVWLKRKLTPRQKQRLGELGLTGVEFLEEKNRFYPKKMLAAHLLGIVGIDGIGLEGLEYRFDDFLRETAAKNKADWEPPLPQSKQELSPRHDLILTIDEAIQYIAQKELSATCRQVQAKAGSVIVMQPDSGEILAMANCPSFNPNSFTHYPSNVRRNRAITDAFEPGSTLKVFIAAAALGEGLFTPESPIWCEKGAISLGNLTIKDTGTYGRLSFSQVLERSSNVGAIKIGLALGNKRLYRYLRRFGFGKPTGINFPGESAGILRLPQQWSKASPGALSIGQEIGVTPLQIVTAMAAIANGGKLLKPRLVRAIREAESGRIVKSFGQQTVRRVISPETAQRLNEILCRVVTQGTGQAAALPNLKVAGKTGTAQKIDPVKGTYAEDKVVASFVGYLPADKPQLVILTMVDEPQKLGWGSKVAAPLFRRIASQAASCLGIGKNLQIASNETITVGTGLAQENGQPERGLSLH